jgi:hypothetical protein
MPTITVMSAPDASARADRSTLHEIVIGPRNRSEARVGEAAQPRLTYRPELDAIRGAAIALVVLQHFVFTGQRLERMGVTARRSA